MLLSKRKLVLCYAMISSDKFPLFKKFPTIVLPLFLLSLKLTYYGRHTPPPPKVNFDYSLIR
jgi:hypothetical protein